MAIRYTDPKNVTSPKNNISDVRPIFDDGPKSVSIAKVKWDGDERLAIRWNSSHLERENPDKISGKIICIGNPSSRAKPTWFILPDWILDKNSLKLNKVIAQIQERKK